MLAGMGLLLDSFWRATAYCLHKRVIAWSLFPLLFMAITAWLLGYFFWADAVVWTEGVLQGVGWLHTVWSWMGVQSLPELVDRKSTRLNSSHLVISYAVFCLKKK